MSRPVLYLRNADVAVQPARPGRVLLSAGEAGGVDADIASAIELRDALTAAIAGALTPSVAAPAQPEEDPLHFDKLAGSGGFCRWTLAGHRGAVTFSYWPADPAEEDCPATGSLQAHSPVRLAGMSPLPETICFAINARCFSEVLRGDELLARWEAAGSDDQLIRAELERLYADRLTTAAVTR